MKHCARFISVALLLIASPSQSAIQSWRMDGTIDYGDLTGASYSGLVSFDDSSLAGSGSESLAVLALFFEFQGNSYTAAQGSGWPTAEFQDGGFLGVSFEVPTTTPAFALVAGTVPVLAPGADAYLGYTPASGIAGFGSLDYTPVPVPAPLVLLGSALTGLRLFRRQPRRSGTA